ncbi:MAG: TIGR00266 family protein [Thermoplasmata archaeon]|nr:MAG: TIGR00266 family protein [Thermoplasmata archaeon]
MKYNIKGNNLQIVTLQLDPGEKVYGEAGSMVYMSENVHMEAKARGGILKGIGRKLMGESFFMTEFTAKSPGALVAFGGRVPGTIRPLNVSRGVWLAQRDAFLVAEDGVEMSVALQRKLSSSFFGGEGFILQRFSGRGTVFIHAAGDFVEFDLKPGETLLVDTASAVAWQESVNYEITRVKGIKTMLFGGEGIFLTRLVGPGKVILQSMNIRELALALAPFMPSQSSGNQGGVLGSIVNNTLG